LARRPMPKPPRRRVVSGRSCWWLDFILRTEDTKGKSEVEKVLRGINPASKASGDGCPRFADKRGLVSADLRRSVVKPCRYGQGEIVGSTGMF
jgi:hypothetical protein